MTNWKQTYRKQFGLCNEAGKCDCDKEIKFIEKLLEDERKKTEKKLKKWADGYTESHTLSRYLPESLERFLQSLSQKDITEK